MLKLAGRIFILLVSLLPAGSGNAAIGNNPKDYRPFRVLVVIGDQWQDPLSYLVDPAKPTGEYSGYDAAPDVTGPNDFHHLVVLLKAWGIPFDVVRLDQQLLDRYMFLDMHNRPRYGTIIWDVNRSDKLLPSDYALVREMVESGIGFIALADRIESPVIQEILGLTYQGGWESNAPLKVKGTHFITGGLESPFALDAHMDAHIQRQQVVVREGTVTLAEQGDYPQVTAREYPSGAHAVWIGSDHNYQFYFQSMRTILRRAITWTIGYNLFKTWENDLIMIMDDPGAAQASWLEHWHYPQLTRDIIQKYLIKPLQEHDAVLNINFVPGYVHESKRRLEPTWNENYTDSFGMKQNYPSGKQGYDEGVKAGVFTVMSHGLTHMQPDLVSEPGWYGAAMDREKAEVGWYREFGDTRRNMEIPAAEQLWRMTLSKEWLTEQFGVEPLEFCPGGLGTSVSYFNNTPMLAGKAGYGWCGWETGYLGQDMVITGWKFFGTSESPMLVPALPDAHDYGVSRAPEKFADVFNQYPKGNFMSMDEFIGYLHARNTGGWNESGNKLTLKLGYDPHYCRYFKEHDSVWRLEIADWLEQSAGEYTLKVDGKVQLKSGIVEVPEGTGSHDIEILF